LVCGLLVLTRPSAQLLVMAVAAWLVWRTGWRAAVRFGAVSVVVVAPWIVRNWVLVGSPAVVTSNGFNLVATYSAEAQASGGFANASVDERFTRINQENRSETDIDDAYREHALDAIREQRTIPLRVVRHNLTNYFELRPGSNESAERDDGRNLTVRNVTLPLFYVVTAAGLVGLWRARRQRGAELLLLQAAYFTVASIAIIAVPRLRVTFDLAAAIGAGLLVAELIGRRAPKVTPPAHDEAATVPPTTGPGARGGGWPRRTRVLAAVGVSITVIAAAAGIAVVRNRVHDNARSRLQRTIDQDAPAIQRLAAVDADGLIIGATAPGAQTDFKQAETVADRLWLLSPRLAGGLRSEGRDTARALDDAIFKLKVLQLVTIASRSQSPATPSAEAIDAARATYETRVRRPNSRLPDWNTISANAAMRRAAGDLERLEHELRA
jgi:hypothetical protein